MRLRDAITRLAPCAALVLAAPLLAANAPGAGLEIEIENLRNHKGQLQVCVTRQAAHFPDCSDDPAALKQTLPASGHSVAFHDLAARRYAVSIVHDENGNGKLDTLLGIPREGFGFSRNPPIRFGPPKFAEAEFEIGTGTAHQTVRVRYLL